MPDTLDKIKSAEKATTNQKIKTWGQHLWKRVSKHLPDWLLENLIVPKWQRLALLLGTALIAAFLMAPKSYTVYNLNIGEPSPETIISPVTFKVVDAAATNKNKDEVLQSVKPVYDFDDEMVHDVQARISAGFSFMNEYLAAEAEFRSREASDKPKEQAAEPDKTKKAAETKSFRVLDDQTLRTRFENAIGAGVSPSNFSMLKSVGFNSRVERDLRSMLVPVLIKGIVLSRDLVMREGKRGILLQSKSKEKLELVKDLSQIFDLKEAVNFINDSEPDFIRDTAYARAVRRLAIDLINVNITYNREKSAAVKQQAEATVKPVYFQVAKGESIIKKGEPVNDGHLKKIAGLYESNPAYSSYLILAGLALALALLLWLTFYFSENYFNRVANITDLLLFCLLFLGTIIMVRFIGSLSPLIASAGKEASGRSILYAAPVATGSMLAALMVDARTGFIYAALTSVTAALAVEGDIYLFVFYFISGIVGLHGMNKIIDRTSVLRAGLLVGLVNIVSVFAIKLAMGQLTRIEDLYDIGLGFLGGVLSGLLVSGLAPLLEPLGYTTNVKLMEIASLNHPLLKQMALEAPGTYHHSMMVGNLAETAAEQIGANPLLARVGALYHDIGKLGKKTKPLYFIENQERSRGHNPHDKLEPSMSALILLSHVKSGVEKAKMQKLGRPIVDIIQQHHGTNVIKYFYNKALEKAEKYHHVVSEDKYRYPGPKPQSKEAAVVMLADVVEAACRTLADPTPARIQKRVQTLIMGLFSEGQLDESTLTLKDLHAITKSFVRSLQGSLHTRIDYPREAVAQERTNGDIHKQQPEKDRHRHPRIAEENGTGIRRLGL